MTAHALCLQGILLYKELSNKQSGRVISRSAKLIILYVVQLIETVYEQWWSYQLPTLLIEKCSKSSLV